MNNRYATVLALSVAAFAMLTVTLVPVSAQLAAGGAKAAPGDAKAGAKGGKGGKGRGGPKAGPIEHIGTVEFHNQPDFGGPGMWNVPYITNMSDRITDGGLAAPCPTYPNGTGGGSTTSCAPFTELGKEVFAGRRKTDSATDPESFCLPPGIPRMMYTPYPMKMIQQPNAMIFVFEGGAHVWREIPIAPRGFLQHDPNFNPSYLGDSYGWWEGDTLVVDTVGMNDRTWLDFAGHPHGEKLHVIERFTRLDTLTLQHVATIEDPEYYTQPWTVTITTGYQPQGKILEYICQENERDTKHLLEDLAKRGITRESVK